LQVASCPNRIFINKLTHQVLDYIQHWQVTYLIGDAIGVGEGLLYWLASVLGETAVTPFKFTRRSKA
jgi:cell shape-determining protein MreD